MPAVSSSRWPGFAPFTTTTGTYHAWPIALSLTRNQKRCTWPRARSPASRRSIIGVPSIRSPVRTVRALSGDAGVDPTRRESAAKAGARIEANNQTIPRVFPRERRLQPRLIISRISGSGRFTARVIAKPKRVLGIDTVCSGKHVATCEGNSRHGRILGAWPFTFFWLSKVEIFGAASSLLSTGTVLGTATFPMAALSALAILSAFYLVVVGEANLVVLGIVVTSLVFVMTSLMPGEDGFLADRARRAADRGQRLQGYILAGLSSAIVPAVVVLVNIQVLNCFIDHPSVNPLLGWCFAYGVATGAWTFRAQIADRRNRTLSSIQAYAAHFSFAILSISVLLFGTSSLFGLTMAIIPQMLPFTVGLFLALADRNALRDVQI